MLDGFITAVFEYVICGLGRITIRVLSLGRVSVNDKDDWWAGLVGLCVTVAIIVAMLWVFG